ncbi:polyprenyl synthetase family protein [Rhodocyclus gracilis]|uniref:Geranylgeranyl pyrophosphate synthase n=1 Tax=Rhodocyclus tenuis TaxID=1066 RepID=A0A6L5JZG0_RHOTE|nr:polyprenyl synthetase family protein [Rhodocyclus gracilis]MQY52707.1 geranylgeranyl pyrophosphate synthase [Rhodocyclus gracilis]
MDAVKRIEQTLSTAIEQTLTASVAQASGAGCPSRLAAALRYAVFPGGARLRPQLTLAVACACSEEHPAIADSAAAAIELLHCGSLVHDDLPCFDDAPIRRGKASLHSAFGERLAVLVGDALIVLAFETLVRGCAAAPHRLAALITILGRGAGCPAGIIAGQAWECEPVAPLAEYQRAKTGALFAAATMAGAAAAGAEPGPWRTLGEKLGEAYQVADDIRDVASDEAELGKPVGRDAILGRPSAAREMGLDGAIAHLNKLIAEAIASIPECSGAAGLRAVIEMQTQRFLPASLAKRAAA